MKTYQLSFGTMTMVRPDIAEVIVHQGIEMNLDMVDEYHMFISEFLTDPCGLLINKKHQYTYSLEAQMALSNLEKIKAIAVLPYTESSRMATEMLMKLPTHKHWNLDIFFDRKVALFWLQQQLGNIQ